MSRVQAAEIRHAGGTFWGVQYHPEYGHHVLAYILDQRATDLVSEGFFADQAQSKAYSSDLVALEKQPRRDICWRLGLNADVVDRCSGARNREFRRLVQGRGLPARRSVKAPA